MRCSPSEPMSVWSLMPDPPAHHVSRPDQISDGVANTSAGHANLVHHCVET